MADDNSQAQNQNQFAPMDQLSQLIMSLPRASAPALPPVASPTPVLQPPTDDAALAVPRAAVVRAGQNLQNSTDKVSDLENKVAAVNAAHANDATTYKPHWYDRLFGAGLGTLAGIGGNGKAASEVGYDVAHRGLERADTLKQRQLAPLLTQLNQERDINLPLYKEENSNALGQLREAREEGIASSREKELQERANKYGSTPIGNPYKDDKSSTGWSVKTADGRVIESGPPKSLPKEPAEPKNYEEALVAASDAYKDGDNKEGDRLSRLAHDMLDARIKQARESRPPKEDKGEKPATKAQFAQLDNRKAQAIDKANRTYRKAVQDAAGDPDLMKQALSNKVEDLRDAQNAYESGISDLGGTPEHWEVDDSGNFTKAGGSAPAPAAAAPAQGGKTVSKDLVQKYADSHKMSYNTALQGFKSKGYTVQ